MFANAAWFAICAWLSWLARPPLSSDSAITWVGIVWTLISQAVSTTGRTRARSASKPLDPDQVDGRDLAAEFEFDLTPNGRATGDVEIAELEADRREALDAREIDRKVADHIAKR